MSDWFRSSRATVAFVSGEPVVRLMIASLVQLTWSSQRLRIPCRSATSELVTAPLAAAAGSPCAWASCPPESARAASAEAKAISAVSPSETGLLLRTCVIGSFLSVGVV